MKKALKRNLSLLLAFTIIFSSVYVGLGELDFGGLFAVKAEAASSGTYNEGTWTLDDNGTLTISGITIIDSYDSKPWDSLIKSVKNIVFESGIQSIRHNTFYNYTNLVSITIPDTVSYFDTAGLGDTRLEAINVDDNNINYFSDGGVLYRRDLPGDTYTLLKYPEAKIGSKYEILENTTVIGYAAFWECKGLSSITIPDSLTSIEMDAFRDCTSLTSVHITDIASWCGISYRGSPDNPLYYAKNLYLNGNLVTDIVIPNSVTHIGTYAFYNCTSLTSVEIPDTVTSIGTYAFNNCTNLTDVYYGGTEADWENITISSGNDYLTNAKISYHEHTYSDEWTVDIEPTYSVEGSKSRHCLNCDAKTDVTAIPAKDFSKVMYVVQEGSTCNGKLTFVVYLKVGVSIGGAIVYVEFDEKALDVYEGGATGNIPGIYESDFCVNSTNVYAMAYVNDFCSFSEDTPFMKITFDINEGYTEADVKFTCKEFRSGNKDYNVLQSETPALMLSETADITIAEHVSSDWIEDSAATVYADGSKHRQCSFCGSVLETVTLPQLVCHTPELISTEQDVYGIVVTWGAVEGADYYMVYRKEGTDDSWFEIAAVTSETNRYIDQNVENNTIYYYTVCAVNEAGASELNREGIGCEYHQHIFGDWEITTPTTCTTDGEKTRTCSCGEKEIEVIEASGHDYSDEWTIDLEATCTKDGSKSHHCTICNDKKDITVIVAAGHNYILDNILDRHPHTKTYICSYCDGKKTETAVVSGCIECNFTVTAIDSSSYKVVSYIGTESDVVIPSNYKGCVVTTIGNGCFKGNKTVTSIKIEQGVTAIGALAFMNCSSLEKVIIPESVTSIGTQAFYGFTGTVYCFSGSTAHEYAVANNIDYVLLSLKETESTRIDYDNFVIYTGVQNGNDIAEIFGVSDTAIVVPLASYIYGNLELYGTGTIITVFDGDDYIGDFTLIVEGDLNGDSVCDVLDATVAQLYSAGFQEPTENEILAANGGIADEIDVNAYQNVVNMALIS